MSVLELVRLDGKTALVTGCRRGIGKAFAVALAEAGADIVGVSKTLEPSGSAIEKEVHALGRKFRSYRCDFANRETRPRRSPPGKLGGGGKDTEITKDEGRFF